MSGSQLAGLADVEKLLAGAGYALRPGELAGLPVLIGESPYALIACVELDEWDHLDERIFDVQAALTRVAAEAPSARNWDLYIVGLVRAEGRDPVHRAITESIEADTRYARKFVRVALRPDGLERALRSLLPLHPPAGLGIANPLGELRTELRELDIDDADAETALESFRHSQVVEVL
jgi:hypothetical protein